MGVLTTRNESAAVGLNWCSHILFNHKVFKLMILPVILHSLVALYFNVLRKSCLVSLITETQTAQSKDKKQRISCSHCFHILSGLLSFRPPYVCWGIESPQQSWNITWKKENYWFEHLDCLNCLSIV